MNYDDDYYYYLPKALLIADLITVYKHNPLLHLPDRIYVKEL